jgi:NAD(P)-dependent dehydrogenase (short-subunit alcohol dehydrogenase family)
MAQPQGVRCARSRCTPSVFLAKDKKVSRNQSVVVTGVSTGIGWGISKILLANGFRVFGSVRRQTDADRLADEFGGAFTPLVMDVTDRESVDRAALQVEERLGSNTLTGLVNNAGIAINVRSFGVPFLRAYVASKHGLEGMSETLRRELMIHRIDVIVIAPGSVLTAIWDKAEAEDLWTTPLCGEAKSKL